MNKTSKIILSIIIFFIFLFMTTTVNANQLEAWIALGWYDNPHVPKAGTMWFADEAVAATNNQKNDFFEASPTYVCGAELTYQTPQCTHGSGDEYCNIYALHAAYCIDEGDYAGSGANNRFLINNIVDLLPDGTVQVYSLSDTSWNTFGPGAYTTQMKQLAYLANRSILANETHVSSSSYKAAIANMVGYYRSTLINMGVDGSLAIKGNLGGSASSAKAQEAIRESANKNYRARFMFLIRNGSKGLGYGQSVIMYAAREEEPLGEIEISKTDSSSGKGLANVGLTIRMTSGEKAGQYVAIDGSGKASYTTQETVLNTGADGRIHISGMYPGNYEIVEKINPNFGYDTSDLPKVVKTGTISAGATENVNITNDRKYIKISGYVWEDMIAEKMSVRNWLWQNDSNDTADRRVMNVEVTLKKADGTVIDTRTTGTITNSSNQEVQGAYIFGDYMRDSNAAKIRIEDLEGAYIEFRYNGMCYKSVQVNTNVDNGNKATDDTLRSNFNENYATVVNGEAQNGNGQRTYGLTYDYDTNLHTSTLNYGGEYLYGYYEDSSGGRQKYPIAGINEQYMITANTKDAAPNNLLGQRITINDILTQGLDEIPNVNLGLWEREMPDMVAIEDLDNVKIYLNGYEHTYEYANRISDFEETMKDKNFNVTVSYESERGPSSYEREFYSSDLSYNVNNPQSFSVYMTYRVGLKNEANTVNTRVNEIMNYYDSRYTIDSVVDQDGKQITDIYEDTSYSETHDGNTYKRARIVVNQDIRNQNATASSTDSGYVNLRYVYIRYKLSNDAINSLLNGEATLNSAVEITSYSSFDDDNFTNRYAGVDRDSEPGSMRTVDPNTYHEDDTNKAISLILKVKEGRIIRGTVWEEDAIAAELNKAGFDRQRIGDGLYNTGENLVGNVKVELLKVDVDGSGNTTYSVADLYKWDNTTGTTIVEPASTYTDTDGSYEFSGIMPSNYVIRYTYGNTSVIYDSNGNSLGNVETEKYKSTIYRNGEEPNSNYWYREETGTTAPRMSDAKDEIGIKQNGDRVDIVDERTTQEEIKYSTAKEEQEDKKLEAIEANTSIFDIKLDYDINLDNISKYGVELKFIFDNIDLGIVRRPIQNLDVRKEIAFVELTLANGQTVISGDPRNEDIQYLKFMPDGSVHIELDDELIQGATLRIQYEIIVDNTQAEIDYNDKNYYYYGTIPTGNAGWKLATVTRLFDYLSNGLEFDATDPENSNWTDIKSDIKTDMVTNGFLSQDAYDVIKTYNRVLATDTFANMQPNEIKTITMKATKLLANNEDDFAFDNDVEVNTLKGRKMEYIPTDLSQRDPDAKDEYVYATPGNYVPGTGPEVESDDDVKVLVITGPTGENNNYLPYILLGISSFIILGTGIIFIKKKVL